MTHFAHFNSVPNFSIERLDHEKNTNFFKIFVLPAISQLQINLSLLKIGPLVTLFECKEFLRIFDQAVNLSILTLSAPI